MKIGRNDLCYCGSGKKYKKCCEEKDQQAALVKNTLGFKNDEGFLDLEGRELSHDADLDDFSNLPAEEQSVIDRWWDLYQQINAIDDIRAHMESFFRSHPQLVEHLGLQHEAIFELGADYLRKNQPGEFISFLLDFRDRFPAAYGKGAHYYEVYVIAWLVSEGRNNEIKNYLDYFIDDPEYVDQTYWALALLLAADVSTEALKLAGKTGTLQDKALDMILFNFLPADIKDFQAEQVDNFVSEIAAKSGLRANTSAALFWSEKLHAMIRPYTPWPDKPPSNKGDLIDILFEPISKFTRYLHDELNISWFGAQYYADNVGEFLQRYHEERKKSAPRVFYFPSREAIKRHLETVAADWVGFTDTTKFLTILNGLYYFAAYLNKCGNFTKEEADTLQEYCIDVYNEEYPILKETDYEALYFSRFPVWK
jgi:hypothetical protein